MSYTEVMTMPFNDLLEFHEFEAYLFDMRAEAEMEQWYSTPSDYRGTAPYRRV